MNSSNKTVARISGILYLIVAITGFFSTFVGKNLIVYGDALATANKILSSGWLFRIDFLSSLIMMTSWLLLAFTLYILFRSINNHIAMLMVLFVCIGCAIICINALSRFGALQVLNNTDYLKVFKPDQLQALALLLLDLSRYGIMIAYIFFGFWLFPLGYLVFKSGFIPGILGIFIVIAGLGYLGDFLRFFIFPDFHIVITNFTFWGEVFLLLWLLIKGVKISEIKTETNS